MGEKPLQVGIPLGRDAQQITCSWRLHILQGWIISQLEDTKQELILITTYGPSYSDSGTGKTPEDAKDKKITVQGQTKRL